MKPSGDCYPTAYDQAASLADAGERSVLLVHGSVVPTSGPWAGRRITHAWVEVDAVVHEFSNGNALVVDKGAFERSFAPETYATYPPDKAIMQNLRNNNYGSWDERSLQMGEAECG